MKYKVGKKISLVSIAQAGPENCSEFDTEYRQLILEMERNGRAGINYSAGSSFDGRMWFLDWVIEDPKRFKWFIEKGFIEEEEKEIKPCPFCVSDRVKSHYSTGENFVKCNFCYAIGPSTVRKEDAIKAWNKAPRCDEFVGDGWLWYFEPKDGDCNDNK